MKKFTYFVATILLFVANIAVAGLPFTAQQIEDAMRAKDWNKAEMELHAIIEAKPSSAKAWWMLAQCEEQLGHTVNARDYTAKAIAFDTSEKFASPGAPEALIRRLSTMQVNPPHPVEQSRVAERPVIIQHIEPPAKPIDWSPLKYILGVIILAGLICWSVYVYNKRQEEKKEEEHVEKQRKSYVTRIVALQTRFADLKKTILYEEKGSSWLSGKITGLSSDADVFAAKLRTATGVGYITMNNYGAALDDMEWKLTNYEIRAKTKQFDEDVPAPEPKQSPSWTGGSGGNSAADRYVANSSGSSQPRSWPTPPRSTVVNRSSTTIINNNNSSNDIVTGMMIENEIDRSREIERERERNDRLEREEESRRQSSYSSRSSSNDSDSWGSSSSSSYSSSSSSSSSVDFGGSSDYGSSDSSSGSDW
jgi:hypothetical protein